ncbi:MAG TPA: hypothetical protein PLM29_12585 [Deltaproteobacteria bacterium]|nr:hypothetical protein [Deltaproteobacteria bacterium]HPJ95419.1 hypothetical protein [Deltaproteobacteria bacterium]
MRHKGCTITVNKDRLVALKTPAVQKRIKENRERSQAIQKQIREDLRVTPDKLKHYFNI